MKEFTVGKNDAGQRLDRFVSKTVPLLPASLLQTPPKFIFILLFQCILQLYSNNGKNKAISGRS